MSNISNIIENEVAEQKNLIETIYDIPVNSSSEIVNYTVRSFNRKNDSRIHQLVYFDSIADMVYACTENRKNKSWKDKGHHGNSDFGDSDKHWTFGDDFPDLESTREALTTGIVPQSLIDQAFGYKLSIMDKYPELFEIEKSAYKIRRKRQFSEIDGELNIDRFMSGDIEMWEKMTKRPTKQSLKIMINTALHCGHDANKFLKGMIMVTAFLDILDKAGITSELWYTPIIDGCTNETHLSAIAVKVKSADELLDLPRILSTGCSGFFRYYCFRIMTNVLKGKPDYGLGRPSQDASQLTLVRDLAGFDVSINMADSEETTFKIITNELKDLF